MLLTASPPVPTSLLCVKSRQAALLMMTQPGAREPPVSPCCPPVSGSPNLPVCPLSSPGSHVSPAPFRIPAGELSARLDLAAVLFAALPLYSLIIKTQHARGRMEAVSLYKRNQRNGPVSILLGPMQARLTSPGAEVWVVGRHCRGGTLHRPGDRPAHQQGAPEGTHGYTDTWTRGNQGCCAQGQEGTESWEEPLTTDPPCSGVSL